MLNFAVSSYLSSSVYISCLGFEERLSLKKPRVLFVFMQISYMSVPLEVVCFCYAKIHDSVHIFQYCSLQCVGHSDPVDLLPS